VSALPTRSVQRWGNSSAVRIPKKVMEQAGLSDGDQVAFEVEEPGLIVIKTAKKEQTLEELLGQVTARNRHNEVDWGIPVGNEVW